MTVLPRTRGLASESLQRRKPRWGDVGRCRVIELVASNNLQTIRTIAYGDLMFGGTCTFNGLAIAKIPHHTI
jgi:hypothetical protein